jgi:hypothetical protein
MFRLFAAVVGAAFVIGPPGVGRAEDTNSPLGTWERRLEDGRIELTFDAKRIHGRLENAGSKKADVFDADYTISPDGTLYGLITILDTEGGSSNIEARSDIPFCLHFRREGDVLAVKDIKMAEHDFKALPGRYRLLPPEPYLNGGIPATPPAPPVERKRKARVTPAPVVPWRAEPVQAKSDSKGDYSTPIIMPPIRDGIPPPLCEEPPSEAAVLRWLDPPVRVPGVIESFRDDIEVVTERLVDRIDPPRFYPLVGPAQLHHCHYKCTVYYTEVMELSYPFPVRVTKPRVEVVYIDKDHVHLCNTDEEKAEK